MIDGSLTNAWH